MFKKKAGILLLAVVTILMMSSTVYAKSYNGLYEGQILTNTVISHYCAGSCCNGKWAGQTAIGKDIWNGMENPHYIAVGSRNTWLPLGSIVEIDGIEFTVADTGSADRLQDVGGIDMFVPEGHRYANEMGLRYDVPVKIIYINR